MQHKASGQLDLRASPLTDSISLPAVLVSGPTIMHFSKKNDKVYNNAELTEAIIVTLSIGRIIEIVVIASIQPLDGEWNVH